MRGLHVNLATSPFRNLTPLYTGLSLLLVLAGGLSLFNVFELIVTSREAHRVSAAIALHERGLVEAAERQRELATSIQGVDLKDLNRRLTFSNTLLARRGFSWTRLFNELEGVIPYGVRMTAVRPGLAAGRLTIALDAEAKIVDEIYEFEERLERSPRFHNAYPTTEAKTDRSIFTFGITAEYSPETPGAEVARPGYRKAEPTPAPETTPAPEPTPDEGGFE